VDAVERKEVQMTDDLCAVGELFLEAMNRIFISNGKLKL
jgi:hypothetical protein